MLLLDQQFFNLRQKGFLCKIFLLALLGIALNVKTAMLDNLIRNPNNFFYSTLNFVNRCNTTIHKLKDKSKRSFAPPSQLLIKLKY